LRGRFVDRRVKGDRLRLLQKLVEGAGAAFADGLLGDGFGQGRLKESTQCFHGNCFCHQSGLISISCDVFHVY
jgi:hypothetical protein